MIMIRRPNGLLVPAFSQPSNKFVAQDVKPDRRKYFARVKDAGRNLGHAYDSPDHWLNHARGRLDACAEVIAKVAVLRAAGRVTDSQPVECTGAVYQDFRGAPKYYERAHRFPCNPWVGIFTLPDLVSHRSPAMWSEMLQPLAVTDIVPNYINHGDSTIEKQGTYPSVQAALREVIQEQKPGARINPRLIQHVMNFSLLPKLRESIGLALDGIQTTNEDEYRDALQGASLFSSAGVEALNQESIDMDMDLAKPTNFLYLTEEYLRVCAKDSLVHQSPLTQTPVLERELDRLQSLTEKA